VKHQRLDTGAMGDDALVELLSDVDVTEREVHGGTGRSDRHLGGCEPRPDLGPRVWARKEGSRRGKFFFEGHLH